MLKAFVGMSKPLMAENSYLDFVITVITNDTFLNRSVLHIVNGLKEEGVYFCVQS